MSNVSEELARLAKLRDEGVLTDAEFEAQKAQVLRGSAPAAPVAPEKKKSSLGKGCGILILIIVVLMIIGALAKGDDKKADGNAVTPAAEGSQEEAAAAPTEVTASQLFNAYQSNEAAAQQQYGGRPLLVTGTVDAIELDFADKPMVQLRTSNQFMHATANLAESDQPKASGLSKGQKVALLCSDVSELMSMPQLKDCRIQ